MPFTNWWPWDMTNSWPNKFAHTLSFRASPEGEGMGICHIGEKGTNADGQNIGAVRIPD